MSEATYIAMKKGKSGQIFHISNEKMISIKSLVKKICKILGKNFDDVVKVTADRIGKDSAYNLSSKKIKKLNWKARISLNDGLEKVIKWMQENKTKIKNKDLIYLHKK